MIHPAWELCHDAGIELSPEGRPLLRAPQSARQFFDLLMGHGCYADARRVLAHAMPKRLAVWWACACVRELYMPEPPSDVAEVLDVAAHYAESGDERSRRRAESLGMQFGPNDLTCCLALAVFFSGGSISRPDLPPVAPAPFVSGRLVEVVVYLASVSKDPARYRDHLRGYLEHGLRLVLGPDPWAKTAAGAATVALPGSSATEFVGGTR